MRIVGRGFIARSLAPIADRHEGTVVLAAGVSAAGGTSDADFTREAALVRDTAARCRAEGTRLVFFSTASTGMYGNSSGPGREDEPIVPCTPYGRHKAALEGWLRSSGVDHLVLRLGHLVGPEQPPHQLLPTLLRQLGEGVVRLHQGAARDLIGVADAVAVIDALLGQDLRAEVVNVASGYAVPVDAVVDRLERILDVRAERVYTPGGPQHSISTEKLLRLVPQVAALGFGPDYYLGVLDSFLDITPASV